MKALSLLVGKLWPRLKFLKVGQTSSSRSQGPNLWYHVKGLVTRNTHVQNESSITSGLKDMAKVNFFVHTTDADGRAMTLAPWTYLSRLAKKLGSVYKFRVGRVTRNEHIFYFGLMLKVYLPPTFSGSYVVISTWIGVNIHPCVLPGTPIWALQKVNTRKCNKCNYSAVEIRRTCRTIRHFLWMSDKKCYSAGPNVQQKI